MQDDYIEEEFLDEESSSNRRPFLVAVGVLVTLFILMGACTAFFLVSNRAANERAAEVAAIETRNAETEASNAATAIAATETAAANPTNTPMPTTSPTETLAPPTLTPTNTPVVEEPTSEIAEAGDESEDVEDAEGSTEETEDSDAEIVTGTETDADDVETPTPIAALSETNGDGSGEALPQTGLDTWGVVLAAFVLVGLVIFARRLRATG